VPPPTTNLPPSAPASPAGKVQPRYTIRNTEPILDQVAAAAGPSSPSVVGFELWDGGSVAASVGRGHPGRGAGGRGMRVGTPLEPPTVRSARHAADRLAGVANRAPGVTARTLDQLTAARVFLKCESLQRTGSFKFRGAYNTLVT